jgi:radical SAM superfamily enzyme YgiQ (UPF0313 family)
VVIRGEAETTLLELTTCIGNSTDFAAVKGIYFKAENAIKQTSPREVMKDLDQLPRAAWDLIDIKQYKKIWKEHNGYFTINFATTRGCPFKCNWCAKPIYGNRYNSRSASNVAEELKFLNETYGFDYIWFCDDIFGLKPGWVHEFAEETKKRNLKLKYKIQSRADLLVQENYVRDLAASGCDNVWMGAESGSQKILDAMDKGTTIDQIRKANALLKSHKIKTAFFLQFGYPGETMEDIDKTIELLNECQPDDIGISVSYPLPGTPFFERVKEELKVKQNWKDSDDLHLMFRNTYSPEFYKQLHKFVHKNYRRKQGVTSLKKLFTHPGSLNGRDPKRIASLSYYLPVVWMEKRKLRKLANHDN